MATCHIALGGNVGDVIATMNRGLELLDETEGVSVIKASPVYHTEPVGPCTGDMFLNAAATLNCDRDPLSLLRLLKAVEHSVGRESGNRWGPRPLDLDLLLIGNSIVSEPPLKVPHPHMWYRRFVLDPLADIAADVSHPLLNESIETLRSRLLPRPLLVAVQCNPGEEQPSDLIRLLTTRHPDILLIDENSREIHQSEIAIRLDLRETHHQENAPSPSLRSVRVTDLPGSTEDAALSVLTAALDQPVRHRRPLRRIP